MMFPDMELVIFVGRATPLAQMRRMAYSSARVPEGDRLGLECQ
jgi:hypothetical protein